MRRPALPAANLGVAHPGEQIPRVIRPDLPQRQPRGVEFLRAQVVHKGEVLSMLSGAGKARAMGNEDLSDILYHYRDG
ncbi:hypothetical protein SDC9_168112 [bioreactor metagenome]|uniref:Uncharacterized protein n=1 Tax=bioreactor metagenome TaxID=1076179 RepID=A0A645GA16_9ZZZZ